MQVCKLHYYVIWRVLIHEQMTRHYDIKWQCLQKLNPDTDIMNPPILKQHT